MAAIGKYRHRVTVENPDPPVPNGIGGFEPRTYSPATPATWDCAIDDPASASNLERVVAGTVIATGSHVLEGRYHAGISVASVLVFEGVRYSVVGVTDPAPRGKRTIAACVEVLG